MSKHGAVYDRVENVVAKLRVLKDSCAGILHTHESDPKLVWFQGAAAILQEAVDGLQNTLRAIESGKAEESTGSTDVQEETPVDETPPADDEDTPRKPRTKKAK